ncbi:M4 family metallopeptidase [Paeniglutamicibacter sp.]|uniref:M4 family metallopeptidase n=1 Tax=Paeniglutamicibacter sp. TaxID=1934391 RepID=UPI00398988E0
MNKAAHPPAANPHPRHHAVPPYLLMSMAACDGAWEAPEAMRKFISRPPGPGEPEGPGPEARTRIATRARQTLLLDQALLHERATTPTDIGRLIEPSGRLKRTVSDAQGAETTPGTTARAEGRTPVADLDANRAHDGLGAVHGFLVGMLKRNSLDGAGLGLRGTVHYGQHYDNAFWDGTQMVMGDGDGEIFNSFTSSLSVIAHEMGHGLLQHTTSLAYRGQSGALNESIADVFGALVEQFVAGDDAASASWLIGEGLLTDKVQGAALRSMAAPGTAYDDPILGKDPQPATMAGYVDTDEDNGGVHLNSGIPNHAFYLFATALGGNAWETAGSLWFNVIATRALPEDADFGTFAEQTLLQARRDHGEGSEVELALARAWDTVGVVPRVKDSDDESPDTGRAPRPRRP